MLRCLSSTLHPLPCHCAPIRSPRPTFTSGQPDLMPLGPLLAQGCRTKVCPLFMTRALSPGLLMNITDWFTEKLKMLVTGIQYPQQLHTHTHSVSKPQQDDDPQRKCFLLRAFFFLECPSSYRPWNRKWDAPPVLLIVCVCVCERVDVRPHSNTHMILFSPLILISASCKIQYSSCMTFSRGFGIRCVMFLPLKPHVPYV